ncbi:MAG: DUF2194 domain-containing protein [Lachnospiraceae bacterium]|nr:DUF2194 domain-containing protein [Lachnospiraceae bacterium]
MKKEGMKKILIPIIILLACSLIVFLERKGVILKNINNDSIEALEFTDMVETDTECLIVFDANDNISIGVKDMMAYVLGDMKIGYDVTKVGDISAVDYSKYKTVVLALEEWDLLGESIFEICDFVENGGNMMAAITPRIGVVVRAVAQKLGIVSELEGYAAIMGFKIEDECMIGAIDGQDIYYLSEEPMEISLDVGLSDKAKIYVSSENGKVPIIWKMPYGEGDFVIVNESIVEKFQRGFLCMAYSTLNDVTIYPVINGSTFYLDDFPSPTPGGDSEYIERDYGVDVASFYSTIWWPRMLELSSKFNIRYSGFIIEKYSDQVEAPFETNTLASQFTTFGNMLLNTGGELGFHGYNHMPLCIKGIDDGREFADYNLWASKEDIIAAMTELNNFSKGLFPKAKFTVYVPPSNIISDAGIEALTEACPYIKVIAGTYLPDEGSKVYEQEFEVDENGIIHTPRVTSGCTMSYYDYVTVFSELNYHFVQSHFTHPDDTLDVDRGAALGWETLSNNLEQYMEWIYASAPMISNLTASELGTAVLKYDSLSVDREYDEDAKKLTVKLGGFAGDAYFLMRINEGELGTTENCEAQHVTGNLYLVHATKDEISICLKG